MSDGSIQKMYQFYEIFNDFNRIRILICLNDEEKSVRQITRYTGLNKTIVLSQLEYLFNCKIILQNKKEKTDKYKIADKSMLKIINDIIKHINK